LNFNNKEKFPVVQIAHKGFKKLEDNFYPSTISTELLFCHIILAKIIFFSLLKVKTFLLRPKTEIKKFTFLWISSTRCKTKGVLMAQP